MKKLSGVIIALLLGIVMLFGIAGCGSGNQSELQGKIDELQSKIEEMENKLEMLEMELNKMQSDDSDNLPDTRAFIICDRNDYEKIIIDDFAEFEVNFDNEMLLVYTFATEYVLPAKIANFELNDKTLTVNYNIGLIRDAGSACTPYQRWFIAKLDKLDISLVESSVSYVYTDEVNFDEEISTYNAKLFDNCGSWIKEKFQAENRVRGAFYD